ncbi:MAG: hypothetical protein HYY40_12445 [Bacteroidetes bacterium]|nr:hypothetical protein [Bacteroidota bacterium]
MKHNGTYNKLIKEAETFYTLALKEYNTGKRKKDDKTIRQGAEKAWNAAVQATKALAIKSGKNIPRSFNAQLLRIREIEKDKKSIINGYPLLSNMFSNFASRLHGNCFYHGEYRTDELDIHIEDVKQYIHIIKNI